LVSTSEGSWIVGVQAIHGNPYDGHTLKAAFDQAEEITGWRPQHAYCDKGYKGYKGAPAILNNTKVHLANKKKKSMKPSEWKWYRRRSGVEPIIGPIRSQTIGWTAIISRAKKAVKSTPSWPDVVSTSGSSSELSFCGFSKSGSEAS
jgi:hypothetical protein